MTQLSLEHVADSPLWRIGLYGCANIGRLQVGDGEQLQEMAQKLDAQASDAGFEVIQSVPVQYSPESEHGYTHTIAIGQSSIVFHTYPEIGTVTVSIETCGDYAYCRAAMMKFKASLVEFYGAASQRIDEMKGLPLVLRTPLKAVVK